MKQKIFFQVAVLLLLSVFISATTRTVYGVINPASSTEGNRNLPIPQNRAAHQLAATKSTPGTTTGWTPGHRQAAQDAMKELRKLRSAIEIGLSYRQYTDRLVDTKTETDEKLRILPASAFKQEISATMEAFADARELWRLALANVKSAKVYLFYAGKIFEKYNIHLDRDPTTVDERVWVAGPTKETFLDYPLKQIWAAAIQHLEQAEGLLK